MKNSTYQKEIAENGHISATPLPTPQELEAFYADLYYQVPQSSSYQVRYNDTEIAYRNLKSDALLHTFAEHGVENGLFLDIGAGEGFLMARADAKGYSVSGVDFSAYGVEKFFPHMKDRLIAGDIYKSFTSLREQGVRFNACSAINILEHVIDPRLFLEEVRDILHPGGLLAITVPNDFSRLQKLLMDSGKIDREFWFVPPQHLHYFDTDTLPSFCESAGYEIVDAFSDFPIDLYLLHEGSNYVQNGKMGASANVARMQHDLLISQAGLDKYLKYYRSMFDVGIGRNITVLIRPRAH